MNAEQIKIELLNQEIWETFHQYETEMTVTKQGRRMFPTLRYKISGLDPNASYAVELRMVATDDYRRKYQNCRWILCGRYNDFRSTPSKSHDDDNGDGEGDPKLQTATGPTYQHPDSPAPGSLWTKHDVSFHKMKLTNNADSAGKGGVLLSSMRKYKPVLMIFRTHDGVKNRGKILVARKAFDETSFIAVTSYQNPKITDLKVRNNPFAKGFRHLRKNSMFDVDEMNFASSLNRYEDHVDDSPMISEQASCSNKKRKFHDIALSSGESSKKLPSEVFAANETFEAITPPTPISSIFLEKSQIMPETSGPLYSNSNSCNAFPTRPQIPHLSSIPTYPFPLFPTLNYSTLPLPGLLPYVTLPFLGSSSNFTPSGILPPVPIPQSPMNLAPFAPMDFARLFMTDLSAIMLQYFRATSP